MMKNEADIKDGEEQEEEDPEWAPSKIEDEYKKASDDEASPLNPRHAFIHYTFYTSVGLCSSICCWC